MAGSRFDARVDDYIGAAAPFAQPILIYVRELVHRAASGCEESIKWQMPFFMVAGRNIAHMAAFKQHCGFGIWCPRVAAEIKSAGGKAERAMGSLGRVTSLKDLPPERTLARYLKMAAEDAHAGKATMPKRAPKRKPPLAPSPEFATALARKPVANKAFAAMRPSHQREYIEWINDAKRQETRDRRITQATAMLAEGKSRNWKHEIPRV